MHAAEVSDVWSYKLVAWGNSNTYDPGTETTSDHFSYSSTTVYIVWPTFHASAVIVGDQYCPPAPSALTYLQHCNVQENPKRKQEAKLSLR